MSQHIEIQNYGKEDVDFIYQLNKLETEKFRNDVVWDKEAYAANIEQGVYGSIFVLVSDAVPVGFFSYHRTGLGIYLHKMFIAEAFQGKGYGQYIVNYLKSLSSVIECQTYRRNQKSFNFFNANGFEVVSENGEDFRLKWVKDSSVKAMGGQ